MYKDIIDEVTLYLKQMGFSKKGNSFYLKSGSNYGVLNFQKSRDSSKHVILFTINFGIYSNALGRSEFDYNESVKPGVERCHWWARVGSFMPNSPDYWWKFNVSDNSIGITNNVIETIQNIVLPEINKRLSDEDLIKSWMNDKYAGTSALGRFKYLTILLKAKDDSDTLNQVVEAFIIESKGKPDGIRAIEHLKSIEYTLKSST